MRTNEPAGKATGLAVVNRFFDRMPRWAGPATVAALAGMLLLLASLAR
jgi:hypothetical protein